MAKHLRWIVRACGVLALATPVQGQSGPASAPARDGAERAATAERRVASATLLTDRIDIDGVPGEAAWSEAPVQRGFVQTVPNPGAPASFETEVRVLQDDQALYVAFRMLDPAPDSVVARLSRRDQQVYSDRVSVAIDGYRDRRTASVFELNAAGVQRDARLSDDAPPDASWDAVWAGAARRTADGWSAEMRIPLSQLRFNAGSGPWGINFTRTIARRAETVEWSHVPQEVSATVAYFGDLQRPLATDPPRHIELRPYVSSRVTREPGDPDDPFHRSNALAVTGGADLAVSLTPAVTLNATINPDFGQVEADPSVVNLSAFPTRYPEQRPFFLEGAEAFRIGGPEVFYSRRIGAAPRGGLPTPSAFSDMPESATILGAVKLSGKTADGWSFGVLDAMTQAEDARYLTADGATEEARVEPAANYGVARVARDFNAGASTIGGVFTAVNRFASAPHLGSLHTDAYAGGFSVRHRIAGVWQLSAIALGSLVRGDSLAIQRTQLGAGHYFQRPGAAHLEFDSDATRLAGSYLSGSVDRIAGGNWRYGVQALRTSPGFEINDLGFGFSNDRMTVLPYARYASYQSGALLRNWNAGASAFWDRTTGGERRELNFTAYVNAQLNSGWGGGLWGMHHLPGVDDSRMRGGPAVWRPARWMWQVNGYSDPRAAISVSGSAFGTEEATTDTREVMSEASVTARPSDRIALSAGPSLHVTTNTWAYVTRRGGAAGDPGAEYVVGRLRQRTASLSLRMDYTLSPTLSLQAYAQPFVSAAGYSDFRAVADPLARAERERFVSADGVTPPDFNFRQMRSTVVGRWEYRPGSALYVVWSRGATSQIAEESFRPGRDFLDLMDTDGRNVLMIKATYWLGL